MYLTIKGTKENIEKLQERNILVCQDDIKDNLSVGYYIETFEYVDEFKSEIYVICPSLNRFLNKRTVYEQVYFSGRPEQLMQWAVNVSAVNPTNTNRVLPLLEIDYSKTFDLPIINEAIKNAQLDDFCYDICRRYKLSYDLLIDIENQKMIFTVWQGLDRSANQTTNEIIQFSKEFENVIKQDYVKSSENYRSTIYVKGEETETTPAIIEVVNNEFSGHDRYEMLLDSSLSRSSTDGEGGEIVLSEAQYKAALNGEGRNELTNHTRVETLDTEVNVFSNKVFGVNYYVGDIVSIINEDLGLELHTRIVGAEITENRSGINITLRFGSNIPDLKSKLKRVIK